MTEYGDSSERDAGAAASSGEANLLGVDDEELPNPRTAVAEDAAPGSWVPQMPAAPHGSAGLVSPQLVSGKRSKGEEATMTIELTAAQARALAELAARENGVTLHQLVASERTTHGSDVYVTPRGSSNGYRIAANGELSSIGETLPAGVTDRASERT